MLLALQTLALYAKKYWVIGVAVIACVVMIVVKLQAQSQVEKLLKDLADNDKRHAEDLKKINDAHQVEISEREQHLKDLEQRLSDIEKQYNDAKLVLDDAKRAEVKSLIEKYSDDPNELARLLSEATGIPIVVNK